MSVLLSLLALALLVWLWQDTLAAREQAEHAAREACGRQSLQFLDGSVELRRTRPARVAGGVRLRRTFRFAYSPEGASRREGFVITLGRRVENLGL